MYPTNIAVGLYLALSCSLQLQYWFYILNKPPNLLNETEWFTHCLESVVILGSTDYFVIYVHVQAGLHQQNLYFLHVSALCANNCYTLGEFHLPTWIFSDFGFFFIYYRILYNCYITVFTTFKMSVGFIFSILLISVKGGAIVIHSWSNLCVKVGFVFVIFCSYLQ